MQEIEVRVADVSQTPGGVIVLLESLAGDEQLIISIGGTEAFSILVGMSLMESPRPLTHDLMQSVMKEVGIALEKVLKKVVVTDLSNNTFYGLLYVDHNGEEKRIDTRPSDAIALALRAGCPIYVNAGVFGKAKKDIEKQLAEMSGETEGGKTYH